MSVIGLLVRAGRGTLADSIFTEVLAGHMSETEQAKARYENAKQEKYAARGYMFQNQFGSTELSRMAELATGANRRGEPRIDGLVYNAMFSVLYLLKGGLSRIGSSEVLRLALERAFPNENNPDAWKQFQEEIGSKYTEPE